MDKKQYGLLVRQGADLNILLLAVKGDKIFLIYFYPGFTGLLVTGYHHKQQQKKNDRVFHVVDLNVC